MRVTDTDYPVVLLTVRFIARYVNDDGDAAIPTIVIEQSTPILRSEIDYHLAAIAGELEDDPLVDDTLTEAWKTAQEGTA